MISIVIFFIANIDSFSVLEGQQKFVFVDFILVLLLFRET